jgi:ABC-2 type transport system ATP-binding protein
MSVMEMVEIGMVTRNDAPDHVIVVENVRKNYGRIEALRGVNLSVRRGEIFGLLGANGAGKTTLIKTLVGSTKPAAGSISVLGMNPVRQARAVRRQIGYMPQAVVLYEDLSPRDNLRFFGRAHGLTNLEQLIDDVLDFTELRARENDPVYNLSGGMKQRASLACAILHRPRLLLLDEPTAGIDPKLREAFWNHFRQLAGDGATILVSTHQMDEALCCDRLAIMRDGVVLACDTPQNLLRYGQATVKIWHDDHVDVQTVPDYRDRLPHLLRRYHLDETVHRIEVEEDTLQAVVLNLIDARETQNVR